MALSNLSKFFVVLSIIFFVASMGLIVANFIQLASDDVKHMSGTAMDNGTPDSIKKGDFLKFRSVDDKDDVVVYIEGQDTGYEKAGSYGDVILFHPNGLKGKTPTVHRAVIYLEFNDTDWNPDNGSLGGFDIPLTGDKNLKRNYVIEDYEYPDGIKQSGLSINLFEILRNFDIYNIEPHSGFVTKGDDNPGADQTSDFYSNDPPWIEPVKEEWIMGRYQCKLQRDPLFLSCCFSNGLLPVVILIGIIIVKTDLKKTKKEPEVKDPEPRRRRYSSRLDQNMRR